MYCVVTGVRGRAGADGRDMRREGRHADVSRGHHSRVRRARRPLQRARHRHTRIAGNHIHIHSYGIILKGTLTSGEL